MQENLKKDREINYTLALGITFPAFVYTTYFMSEVIYLLLSLWVIYIVWCIFCTENFRVRLALNLLLGVMCYLTYLNKEIALYFVIAYVLVWLMYCIAHLTTEKVGGGGNLPGGFCRDICGLFFIDERNPV